MKDIRIVSLYSGSTGNACLIDTPYAKFLIDAGKNAKKLCSALAEAKIAPSELSAIFLTHEHHDHVSALPVFLKKHPMPVHIVAASAYRLCEDPAVSPCLHLHTPLFSETLDGVLISSFPTSHDSRASVGYRIEIPRSDGSVCRIGYATDVGYVSKDVEAGLLGCDAVVLESNHDPEMLQTGPYPYELQKRILSRRGHLSNPDSAAFAARLCNSGTKSLMLAHLSLENNTPELAYEACLASVGDDRIKVCITHPDCPTEVFV